MSEEAAQEVLQRVNALAQSGGADEAAADLERLVAAGVRHPLVLMRLGDFLRMLERWQGAETAYRMAIANKAPELQAHQKLAIAVARAARIAEDGGLLVPPGDGRARAPSAQDVAAMAVLIDRELEKSPAVLPSRFWQEHGTQHFDLLMKHGLENFKRTVAHNYYNWLTINMADPQIGRLLDLWPHHSSMELFTDRMEPPGAAGMPVGADRERYALLNEDAQKVYKLGVSLLWDYTLLADAHGILRRLAEPLTGNPLRIWRRGRLLSQDLAHSVRERNTILDGAGLGPRATRPILIGELGAGHGRLAHVFHMTTNCRYFIFDISPALAVSQWYVTSLFPDEPVFKFRPFERFEDVAREVDAARFAFFSANQLEMLPEKYFDLFVNICSLMEMREDTIDHYFGQIRRVTRSYFYTKQWFVQNNRQDGIVIEKDDYPVPPTWRPLLDREDRINPRLFEQLWQL